MSTIHHGGNWYGSIYVNGAATNTAGLLSAASSASTTYAPWIHLYFEANTNFNDDMTIFARYTKNEYLPGK
eukprot:2165073-Pyramimonas_sp.AAC.1